MSNEPASTKFWGMEDKIKKDKKTPGVFLSLRKANMKWDIVRLVNDDVIDINDLKGFSEELRDEVHLEKWKNKEPLAD